MMHQGGLKVRDLEVDGSTEQSMRCLLWDIHHTIDESSPLYEMVNQTCSPGEKQLLKSVSYISLLLTGTDEDLQGEVTRLHAWAGYPPHLKPPACLIPDHDACLLLMYHPVREVISLNACICSSANLPNWGLQGTVSTTRGGDYHQSGLQARRCVHFRQRRKNVLCKCRCP